MIRIVVAAKQDKILLQDSQSKALILDQPSIIQIGVTQQEVKTLVKSGDNLIITLTNGEQIVLEHFFQADGITTHSLVFPQPDGSFTLANFNESGKFTNYSGLQKLDTLLYEGAETANSTPLNAYEASAAESVKSDFSLSNLFSSKTVKAGLGLAGAIGLGLALLDSDSGSSSSNTLPDMIAPKTPTATLSEDGKTIKGTAEANSTIYVVDKTEKVIATVQVDKDGNYSVTLPDALLNNNSLYINAKDKAGNASNYTQVTGTKDTIAPDAPQAQLNENGSIVTGHSEANATINVYDASGQLIGTAKANAQGQFSIAISPAITGSQTGTVEAIDSAGNKSESHKIEFGKDTLAPDQPKFEVAKDGASIKGTAEANAKVIIQDSTGTVIGTATVDANGKFTVAISPALDSSKTGKIIIEDAAGNQSKAIEIKAEQDALAPEQPVANLNAEGSVITGTAEANAKISVYDSANKLLGSATADANGLYTVTLSTALTESKTGSVSATDAAGNQSTITTVSGTKDITAPSSPKIGDVTDDVGTSTGSVVANGTTDDKRPVISGTGEVGATLIVYDNNQAIGNVKVGTDGKWSFSFDYDLSVGSHSITTVQTDKAGNTSLVSDARTFTVVESVATSSIDDTSLNNTATDTDSSVTALGDSLNEPVNIFTVLGDQVVDTDTVNATSLNTQSDHALILNDVLTTQTAESSQNNVVDSIISDAISKHTSDRTVDALSLTTSSVNKIIAAQDISVLQSDVISDLLNVQSVMF
ncbi:Ig-like repeat protein Blp2 [Acinetobacter sp. ULE_I010]|uniref:Ig-like repeat protein Blp2 n=1 Tax=Acinetobacter sp. ULE_I010 TaxID=3373065 RepID=UPI003AF940DC